MAGKGEVKISLKLMVDTKENKVVFAEADKHFVDVLFSFLTLPVGTIVRLLGEESRIASLWSLTNLYYGVDRLDPKYFPTEECKKMLLRPMNASGHLCKNLKLNIDDTESIKYFCCSSSNPHLSLFKRALCSCGPLEYEEIELWKKSATASTDEGDGVFLKSDTLVIITDNLQVEPGTYGSIHLLLNDLGISDLQRLKEMTVEVGLKELTRLLELSLLSKSPLTDMFLREDKYSASCYSLAPKHVDILASALLKQPCGKMFTIKLLYNKSDSKVLYAEAKEDFIDFLFSILTLPLGSVVRFLGMKSSLTCIDNLYESAKNLTVQRPLQSLHEDALLNPSLPPFYKSNNQLLDVCEMSPFFIYHRGTSSYPRHLTRDSSSGIIGFSSDSRVRATLLDPKDPEKKRISCKGERYVRKPTDFMVTDDLTVRPLLSPFSTIGLLKKLGLELNDIVQSEISVGKEEALSLLKASLHSTSALTTAFNPSSIIGAPKQEK